MYWENKPLSEDEFYPAGTWGPPAAEKLINKTGRKWRNPDPPDIQTQQNKK
jgi:glucose-6-phosphate 1-dehydrogenase